MLRYDFAPTHNSSSWYGLTAPPRIWQPFTDMKRAMTVLREDCGFKLTEIGDQYIDMMGSEQRDPLWDFTRFLYNSSGSNAADVLLRSFCGEGETPATKYKKLFDLKVGNVAKDPTNEDMQRGIEYEDSIIEEFENRYDFRVATPPFIPHGVWVKEGVVHKTPDRVERLGVSPDGIIIKGPPEENRAAVEIKCPREKPLGKMDPNKFVTYLNQVQYQIWTLNATHCYLVQGRPPSINTVAKWQMHVEKVPRDPNWAYHSVGPLLQFTDEVHAYRAKNGISYNKYLERQREFERLRN